METSTNSKNSNDQKTEFKRFATKRIIVCTLLAVVGIWLFGAVLGFFEKPSQVRVAHKTESPVEEVPSADKAKPEISHEPSEKQDSEASESSVATEGHESAESPETTEGSETTEGPKATVKKRHYDKDTAGGIMTPDFIALDKTLTAQEAVEHLREKHHDIKQPVHLFVVDEHGKLLGTLSMEQLMFAASDSPLEDFMDSDVMSVKTGLSNEKVKNLTDRHHLQTIPVVDNTNRLVGIVKADQVIHLAKKETAKTAIHAPAHREPAESVTHAPAPAPKAATKKPEHALPSPHKKTAAPSHAAPTHKETAVPGHAAPTHGLAEVAETKPKPKGVAFVEATIKPLSYELNERFWGWRVNDILDFTDNVNNFQLGVLEVTRRTAVSLTERISRTGTTAAFDRNLENAMNWFMIKSDRYWFPSPEAKYKAGLDELKKYKEKLEIGEARFHTRTDNLIPLLMSYEDLLGSCEENLVKAKEDDGSTVSFFKADDYFYYAQGIASAMGTILHAVLEDFLITVESRRGAEVLHHAIESCHHAAEIDPLLITNSSLSGILANHRANLAAPMSHARFYINVLIKTLST
jgi:CBS domain-containing protein